MEMRTPALLIRPWRPDDVERLMELCNDPGVRARWGVFKEPMNFRQAGFWISSANHSLAACKLGSWAAFQGNLLVGCLNLVHRHLDNSQELVPTLEVRLRQGCPPPVALQGVQALIEYGRGLSLPEVYWFLTSEDSFLRELAGALGMAPVQRAFFEKVAVDVYSLKLGAGVEASAPTPGLSAVKKN